jgi:lipopolysaccharide/colanic/teichoic acid biosynthesis glycosyltransferase
MEGATIKGAAARGAVRPADVAAVGATRGAAGGDAARVPRPYRGKRLFDLALVLAAAPLWVPALGVVALLVRRRLGTPVLFRQRRPGLHGRPFELRKFRTMTDARDASGRLLPDAERLTPFGRWLRSTSLDELPELVNVLRGEMSLVGPRPLLEAYLPLYSERHALRHAVPPGLTGLAQVSGRNALTWPERFDLDVRYAETNSLAADVAILWRTVRAVVRREGISAAGDATMYAFTGYDSAPPPAPPPAARPPAPADRA